MQLGTICPTSFLKLFAVTSDYHLVLAHMVEQCEEYRTFYAERAKQGDYITLDNSGFEMGDDIYTSEQLIDLAFLVGAQEVMAPEHYLDMEKTATKVKDFMADFEQLTKEKSTSYPYDVPMKVFGTLHGRTIPELTALYRYFCTIGVDTIGFSCRLDVDMENRISHPSLPSLAGALGRVQIIQHLISFGYWDHTKRHHLLGLNHPYELTFYPKDVINSNDSSCAFMNGLYQLNIDNIFYTKPADPIDFNLQNLNYKQIESIFRNIRVLKGLAEER